MIAVYFEVQSVHCGIRVQQLLEEEASLVDEIRRLELQYNKRVSPPVLMETLPEEFERFDFPKDGESTVGVETGAQPETRIARREE